MLSTRTNTAAPITRRRIVRPFNYLCRPGYVGLRTDLPDQFEAKQEKIQEITGIPPHRQKAYAIDLERNRFHPLTLFARLDKAKCGIPRAFKLRTDHALDQNTWQNRCRALYARLNPEAGTKVFLQYPNVAANRLMIGTNPWIPGHWSTVVNIITLFGEQPPSSRPIEGTLAEVICWINGLPNSSWREKGRVVGEMVLDSVEITYTDRDTVDERVSVEEYATEDKRTFIHIIAEAMGLEKGTEEKHTFVLSALETIMSRRIIKRNPAWHSGQTVNLNLGISLDIDSLDNFWEE